VDALGVGVGWVREVEGADCLDGDGLWEEQGGVVCLFWDGLLFVWPWAVVRRWVAHLGCLSWLEVLQLEVCGDSQLLMVKSRVRPESAGRTACARQSAIMSQDRRALELYCVAAGAIQRQTKVMFFGPRMSAEMDTARAYFHLQDLRKRTRCLGEVVQRVHTER
jgi:hypothetical protein